MLECTRWPNQLVLAWTLLLGGAASPALCQQPPLWNPGQPKVTGFLEGAPTKNGAGAKVANVVKGLKTLTSGQNGDHPSAYDFVCKPGRLYQIDLESSDFDTFLRLTNAKNELVADDDDGGSQLNSRLYFVDVASKEPVKYRLHATSFLPEERGKYSLSVRYQDSKRPQSVYDSWSFQGRLTKEDRADRDRTGCHCHIIHAALAKDVDYTINLISTDFDTYLRLEQRISPNRFKKLLADDDSGGEFNARLKFAPKDAGTYRIIVTTYRREATGLYTLEVDAVKKAPLESP